MAPQLSTTTPQIQSAPRTSQFTLFFRVGANPYPQSVNFNFSGTFRDAIVRAQKHCEIMNYRFVSVRPAIIDMDEVEKHHLGDK